MDVFVPWLLSAVMLGQAPGVVGTVEVTAEVRAPASEPLPVQVIALGTRKLVAQADLWIYTSSGKCIRRGRTRVTGEVFASDQGAALLPAYRKLLVVARDAAGATGAMTIVFDDVAKVWRPVTSYEFIERSPSTLGDDDGQWRPIRQYDEAIGRFLPLPESGLGAIGALSIKILIPARPTPISRLAPGSRCCGPEVYLVSQPEAPALPAGTPAPPFQLPSTGPLAPEVERWADHEAALVSAGAPLAESLPWADFGKRWAQGPHGMYWQAAIGPRPAEPTSY